MNRHEALDRLSEIDEILDALLEEKEELEWIYAGFDEPPTSFFSDPGPDPGDDPNDPGVPPIGLRVDWVAISRRRQGLRPRPDEKGENR